MNPDNAPKPSAPPTGSNWHEELGLIPRFPYPYGRQLIKFLGQLKEPRISLQSKRNGTEIVIRFAEPSVVFPPGMIKHLAKFGITLSQAFEGVLWTKQEGESNTTWTELARPAIKAYREAWLHFFELTYLRHFHPKIDARLSTIGAAINSESKILRRGRMPASEQETESLRARYCELLRVCKGVHRAAEDAVAFFEKQTQEPSSADLKRAIWKRVGKDIHGMPGDSLIFSGEAFKALPRRSTPLLEAPGTWKPHQLAISLVAIERNQQYQTVEKKVQPTKFPCRRSSHRRK